MSTSVAHQSTFARKLTVSVRLGVSTWLIDHAIMHSRRLALLNFNQLQQLFSGSDSDDNAVAVGSSVGGVGGS
jgi:hypothetical protein